MTLPKQIFLITLMVPYFIVLFILTISDLVTLRRFQGSLTRLAVEATYWNARWLKITAPKAFERRLIDATYNRAMLNTYGH